MKALQALLTIAAALALPTALTAQGYVYAIGNQSFSTQIPIDGGFINVNNGEVHLELPLARNVQRGRLQLNERLVYDSRIWKIISNGGYWWSPTNVASSVGGWRFLSGLEDGTVNGLTTAIYSSYCGLPDGGDGYDNLLVSEDRKSVV